jgi:hypothetical protein
LGSGVSTVCLPVAGRSTCLAKNTLEPDRLRSIKQAVSKDALTVFLNGINYIHCLFNIQKSSMSTVKPKATPATPATPSVASPLPDATAQAAVKTPAAQQATAGKLAAKKPAAKKLSTARKPVTKAPPSKTRATVKPEKEVKTGQTVKLEKTRKPKLVRDSFTIPKVEYVVLEALKQRANGLGLSLIHI